MLRKFFLLILFAAFLALMLTIFKAETGVDLFAFSDRASPSTRPLPKAWAGAARAGVRLAAQPAAAQQPAQPAAGACPSVVQVARGDTLGGIARRCGVALADMLAANPEVKDPNRIYPGQPLYVYGARGGADPAAVTAGPPPGGFAPGAAVILEAEGFAPNAQVKVGIGLPGAGFKALGTFTAGRDGRLSLELTIPAAARSGERAFFLLSSTGVPTTQIVSDPFVIE